MKSEEGAVIVRLFGGLGNQMFQYAFARNLAYQHHLPLKLDVVSGFAVDPYKRQYALDIFCIQEHFATPGELPFFARKSMRGLERATLLFQSLLPKRWRSIIADKDPYAFDAPILGTQRSVYVTGYWQNEKYFKPIESLLRKEFSPRCELTPGVKALMREMTAEDSVSIHIRQLHGIAADGRSIPQGVARHGACSSQYYERAIARIRSLVRNPQIFIFSDSVEWCKPHADSWGGRIVATEVEASDTDELFLMASCQHHVVSNSTFSWWGAWLNPSPTKIVIAPNRWLRSSEFASQNLLSQGWIGLDCYDDQI